MQRNVASELWYREHMVEAPLHGHEDMPLGPQALAGYWDCQAINAKVVCDAEPDSFLTKCVLRMLGSYTTEQDECNRYFPAARIEFLHSFRQNGELGLRGAVVYDGSNRPALHMVNALVGYYGKGPELSAALLASVGVPSVLFLELNEHARPLHSAGLPYAFIVERRTSGSWWWRASLG